MFKEFGYSFIVDENNFIVRDHIVHGAKIMPGIVLLDMCIKVLLSEKIDYRTIEFRNILFKAPIELQSCKERELIISLKNVKDKSYIQGKSRVINGMNPNNTDQFVDHFECEIYQASPMREQQFNVAEELSKPAISIQDMDNAYKFVRSVGITHKSFMKAEGQVYCFSDKIVTHNKLSKEANEHKDKFFHQPSMMDSSTIIPYLCIHEQELCEIESKAFIPIHIEKFLAFQPLKSDAYIYINKKDVFVANSGDITNASWKIYDESGNLAADIVRLSSKRIREIGMATKQANTVNEKESAEQTEQISVCQDLSMNSNGIEQYIIKKIEELRNIEIGDADLETGFYELGLDSRDLISVVKNIENETNIKLYPTVMFEYSNIKDLAEYLKNEFNLCFEEHHNAVMEYYQKPQQPKVKEQENQKIIRNQNCEKVFYETVWNESMEPFQCDFHSLSDLTVIITNDFQIFQYAKGKFENVVQICSHKVKNEIPSENCYGMDPFHEQEVEQIFSEILNGKENVNIINMFDSYYLNEFALKQIEQLAYDFNVVLCKSLMKFASKTAQIRILNIGYHDVENNCYTAALAGFYKCLELETSGIISSIITLEYDKKVYNSQFVWNLIQNELALQKYVVNEVRYFDEVRYTKKVMQVEYSQNQSPIFKDQGCYIITGGMGAISKSLVKRIKGEYHCVIILLGRSSLSNDIQTWITSVNNSKAKVIYHSIDICDPEAVANEVQWVMNQYGKINGVIHAAACVQDAMVISKEGFTEQEDISISTKIRGLNNLDRAIGEQKIDYMILFSSISAIFGNLGQSNYAYGNSYMDSFAYVRNQLVEKKSCYGRTLSINWPLWESGGMDVGYDYQHIFETTGIEKLNQRIGIDLLIHADYTRSSQVIMLNGVKSQIDCFIAQHYMVEEKHDFRATTESKDIAIIGIGGQFPMAENILELWENLKDGKDCIQTVPEDRWTQEDINAIIGEDSRFDVSNYGGFLKEIDKFDSRLFHITPSEAKMMDPQERLFLMAVWSTLEDAGYSMKQLTNKDIGVFAGVMWGQYQMLQTDLDNQVALPSSIFASIANRVSYYFNWHGPSLTIDTMCSSSMTALKMACDSILNNESIMAIAGGVNLSVHPAKYIILAQNNFTSRDGRCRTFGENGTGYVPGEGVGVLLLKKLDKAVVDGDHIYGVIKACEINHGGRTGGYSVPSVQYQSKVIERALRSSKISASDISYIEAHGTGTELGDPIEIRALQSVFSKYTNQKQFCSIGSIKSNIGHLEAASGIAGIIKVLLQMKYKKLVPSLHSKRTNPNIEFEETAFYCQQNCEDWNPSGSRIAAVSAFGAGGSNAHLILQEYETIQKNVPSKGPRVLVFSAYSQEVLKQYILRHKKFLMAMKKGNNQEANHNDFINFKSILAEIFEVYHNDNEFLLDELNFDLYKMVKLDELLKRKGLQSPSMEQFSVCKSIDELEQLVQMKNVQKETQSKMSAVTQLSEEEEQRFLDLYEYTLQIGRVHMKKRLAIVASSIEELIGYFDLFLQNKHHENIIFKQSDEEENSLLTMFKGGEGIHFIQSLFHTGNLNYVARIWVEGIDIEWGKFIDTKSRIRISIPTYPFSNEKIPSAQLIMNHEKKSSIKDEMNEDLDLFEIIKKVENGVITVDNAISILERGI